MFKIKLYPYALYSSTARKLKECINVMYGDDNFAAIMVKENGAYSPKPTDIIIGWGNPRIPSWYPKLNKNVFLNKPEAVAIASSKYKSFVAMSTCNVPIPNWTTNKQAAEQWVKDGKMVVGRMLDSASGGRGVLLLNKNNIDEHACKLYTEYLKKKFEYRVHVFDGKVIDVQQKRKKVDAKEVDYQIRNYDNGWVYCRDNIDPPPERVLNAAQLAVKALNLNFGAVDVGYNTYKEKAIVYEVNTAPGLEGTTLMNYADNIINILNLIK